MATDSQDRLRYWVRTLGNLLGETIVEQEGEETFALEEELRALAKNWRAGDQSAQSQITHLASQLVKEPPRALAMLKAFSTYFQLVNLAEESGVDVPLLRLAQAHLQAYALQRRA